MPRANAKNAKINTEKRIRIETAKLGAPKVPGDTCPSINYVQEMLDQIAERGDEWSSKQSEYATDILEYVRQSNEELRRSSKYWYDKFKEAA